MKTASYAVMFTDIKGFTEKTSRQTRAQNERLLRLHDALLLPAISGYGGRRVKSIGDAYLVIFDSATRALACGAALQDRLALYNRKVEPSERIEVRVAINAGEVRVERDDVFGEAVNIASRVEEHADAGAVYFTEAVYLLADRTWIEVDDLGPHSLRGIPEAVRLYRLQRKEDGLPYGGAALSSLHLPDPDPAELARRRFVPARPLRWTMGGFVAVAVGVGIALSTGATAPIDRIEGLAEGGRVGEAQRVLRGLPPEQLGTAERAYLEGLIARARGDQREAIRHLSAAAASDPALGERRVGPRLVDMLDAESCEVRVAAAQAIGEMDYEQAAPALERVAAEEPQDDGLLARLRLGGCNAGDAAREALRQLAPKG